MELIASYRNAGFEALADGVRAFFVRRTDLQRPGVAFGPSAEPAKISTDISLVAIDRSDPEAYALAGVILRGLRALSDFEFELQIAHTNHSLAPAVETLFLATAVQHSFLSSSVVREVARFGGDVRHLVPEGVALDLARLFNRVDSSQGSHG